jgi:hypothetical protein
MRAATLIRVAYFFPAFWILSHVPQWETLARPRAPDWLWPVAWLSAFDVNVAGPVLFGTVAIGSCVAALLAEHRWARGLAFVCLLEFLGLKFAYGKIHHVMHAWLLTLGVFVLLPKGFAAPHLSRAGQHAALQVFAAAQLLIALTYAMSGLGKLGGIVYQLFLGQVTSLHPSSLARHLADRISQTNEPSLWGHFMIEHGRWFWPAMLGTLYLQVFALAFAARPRLHGVFGAGLILFHAFSILSLTIDFTPAVVLLGLLFCVSPFTPDRTGWRAAAADLPIFSRLIRLRM